MIVMAGNQEIIVSEILCFIHNKFGNLSFANIKSLIVGFYDEEDVVAAKTLLHQIAVKLLGDKVVGRLNVRKAGDNKLKLDTQDLLEIYKKLDQHNASMPLFVAANLAKLPIVHLSDTDVSTFAAALGDIRDRVEGIQRSLDADTSCTRTVVPNECRLNRAASRFYIRGGFNIMMYSYWE
jgi:hypothetical protein